MSLASSAEIRASLDHPIVDADGHLVEVMPLFEECLRDIGGNAIADRYAAANGWSGTSGPHEWSDIGDAERRRRRVTAPIWWANPTGALDRATAFLPSLLYERLDEIGIDYTILYPSVGGMLGRWPDEDIRLAGTRALNTYLAQEIKPFADRMTVAAVIPAHTPQEAIAELDYAVKVLGAKVVVLPSYVERPIAAYADLHDRVGRDIEWIDVLALDSDYDYDPVWQRCIDLGVAVTTHTGSHGLGFRRSISTFMYNHIGHFSEAGDAFAKALFFGGVTRRFPKLNFAFLEQGVARGVGLYAALIERWNKRGGANIKQFDPTHIDWAHFDALVARYGRPILANEAAREFLHRPAGAHPQQLDDFARCDINDAEDIYELFVPRFYFGCEADDRMNSLAFDTQLNPYGAQLNAILSSDLSHWDVPDMLDILREAHELVDDGLITDEQFRAFSADNCIRLHGQMNPRFFDGTIVEHYAAKVLNPARPANLRSTALDRRALSEPRRPRHRTRPSIA